MTPSLGAYLPGCIDSCTESRHEGKFCSEGTLAIISHSILLQEIRLQVYISTLGWPS